MIQISLAWICRTSRQLFELKPVAFCKHQYCPEISSKIMDDWEETYFSPLRASIQDDQEGGVIVKQGSIIRPQCFDSVTLQGQYLSTDSPMHAGSSLKMTSPASIFLAATMYLPTTGSLLPKVYACFWRRNSNFGASIKPTAPAKKV